MGHHPAWSKCFVLKSERQNPRSFGTIETALGEI